MSNNQCAACGQWSGRGHKCPTPTAVPSAQPPTPPTSGTTVRPVSEQEVSNRVARAQEAIRSIAVYGASDDLIEVDGDLSLEVDAWDAPPTPVMVNGQHALTIAYGRNGNWNVTVNDLPEGVEVVSQTPAVGDTITNRHPGHLDRYPSYSDVVVLKGEIDSVEVKGEKAWKGRGLPEGIAE